MKTEEFTITEELYASQFQRFLNLCIDLMFIYIIVLSLGTTVILVALSANNFELSNWTENLSRSEIGFYSVIVAFLYYYLTEAYFSRTFAKLITHTIVVNIDGTKPSVKRLFIRTCCRFIPFEVFTFLKEFPRGWHDTLSETYVVKKRKLTKKRKHFNATVDVVNA
ncbi:RDD family protein [Flavobacterium flavipallidum]|uniref:RDD family protein n=1 Tax=Flavobacterium flavipallidum TaxID=3139140 RepID=A0ABU9HHR8_9FLAO